MTISDPEERRRLYEEVLAPGEGIIAVDQDAEVVEFERLDGGRVSFLVSAVVFERAMPVLADAGRSQLGDGGSELVNAGRWLLFVMTEVANDMSPAGRRGYRLAVDGTMVPWD